MYRTMAKMEAAKK